MKRFLSVIVFLSGLNAHAGFLGDSYSNDQLRFENRCGIPICRANDNGKGFVKYCELKRQSTVHFGQPVYVWHGDNGSKCYCPCDYAFEYEVTRQQ